MALPVAVLDACVLFPEWLRDLFLRLAEAGLIRVAWTDEILEEMRRNLGKVRNLAPEKTAKLVAAMRRAFPDADVDDYADHISSMTNHPKDRHVLAAAQVRALEGRLDNAGDDANEYLVALEDLLLADEDFDAAFTELVKKNRRSTLARLLRLLARDEVQPMILENLRRLGVRLPVDELLALTVDEFDLVLDQAAHAKH